MSLLSRIAAPYLKRADDPAANDSLFFGTAFSSSSSTGIQINQHTALQASAVLACVRILSEDVSKMRPLLKRPRASGGFDIVKDHWLARLFRRPNDWQTWPEFARQMVIAFALRGNAYAVMLRDGSGRVYALVPINPDMCRLWESPDGSLWWMVTRVGLHQMAILRHMPLLIAYEDMFHLKDMSHNGLVGLSPISLQREAIGLSLAQQEQYAKLMANGARPSGVLTTDKALSDQLMERLKKNWSEFVGTKAAGKTAILEAGMKWVPLTISSVDLQFLQLRQFQLSEISRMFRVPPHMIGDLSRGTFNNIVQQAQEYRNNTLTSHSDIWEQRFEFSFELMDSEGLVVDLDETALLKADIVSRFTANRVALGGAPWKTVNEVRLVEGMNPDEDPSSNKINRPANLLPEDSDQSGEGAPGGGAPDGKGAKTDDTAPGAQSDDTGQV
jgi:HK97 family phage portal protein